MSIAELYDIFKAHPHITTDTREITEGDLFFALHGDNFDGNNFALQALEAGCAYAVVDNPEIKGDNRIIHTDDTLRTLQDLAAYHRDTFHFPVIQITGTNGKTTTKELTTAVLSEKYNVLATQGNFNNHIGVPKTLLRLTSEHEIAVIETGANHPGEIAQLSEIVHPDCGLITNVGRAHLAGFGSFEGVIRTKTELYEYLRKKEQGFIFLDADNEYLTPKAQGLKTITYGTSGKDCTVIGQFIECNPFLKFRFRYAETDWTEVQTHLIGSYNLTNALAAICVGSHFGIAQNEAAHAVSNYIPTNNRSELLKTESNRLIVDAYNANPTSMKAALDNFAQMADKHKMAILGEMRELGSDSAACHKAVAEQAKSMGLDELWLVGKEFEPYADPNTRWFLDEASVEKAIAEGNKPNDRLILVKGSNGTKLFRLPQFL